jgi:two-component system cell cycle response regulator DivK
MSGPLVLIADDDQDVLAAHSEMLELAGYRVCQAHDGREALAQALEQRPDVILMDLDMPELDGWEATRRIRADLRTHRIPVIALTGYGLRRYRDRSFEAGCSAFVDKSGDPRGLVAEIERALRRRTTLGAVVVDVIADVGSGATLVTGSTPPRRRW